MRGRFVAVDVETANDNLDSVCQVGIATFEDGALGPCWTSLVNPNDYFESRFVDMHGITPERVAMAPTAEDVATEVCRLLDAPMVVSHTSFTQLALEGAVLHLREFPDVPWYHGAILVRQGWPEYKVKGYGLAAIADVIGIDVRRYDAMSEAIATGKVLLAACERAGIASVEECIPRCSNRLPPHRFDSVGPLVERCDLVGEHVVFTGTIGLVRRDAAALAELAGCVVLDGVTKKTTLLVVGNQDLVQVGGDGKSSKHRKAEQLAAAGQPLRIIKESDFLRLVKHD